MILSYSAQPTNKLANPPNPLKRATNSGIPVILTDFAVKIPINAPIRIQRTSHLYPRIFSFSKVTTTATIIPSEENRLPRRAVTADPNIFMPKIKRIAAAT